MPVPNLTRADARTRAELLTVSAYEVEIDLTDGGGKPGERTFRSRSTVRFAGRPGGSTFVDVVAASFRAVTLNGRPLDTGAYTPQTGIALTELAADNVLVVDADCLYTNTGEGLHRFVDPVDGEVYLYSQFETADAKRMYTCFDQPDLKGTFALTVTAPAHWEVVSNGRAEQVTEGADGAQVVRFATTPPLSSYVTALVAGPYHKVTDRHDGIDLGVYCRASLAQHLDAEEILLITKQGFDWYHRAFDYRYPFDKYDQLFVPEFNAGAMENAGCVTFADDWVFDARQTAFAHERRAETILHEMAHMWFGDLVTMRWWDDLWLNESFATFVSVLCCVEATAWTGTWRTFASIDKAAAYAEDQLSSTHPIAADIPDIEAVGVNFDGITYAKGAGVLKQLAAYVGIEAFLGAMRVYFRRHEYGNTTLADLLAALAEESGRDLSGWAAQWLETSGVNTLRAETEVGGDGRYTSVVLVQTASPEPSRLRDHRVAVGLYRGDGALVRTSYVELDVRGARTEVPQLVGIPEPDLLLPNDDDLDYCRIRLTGRSLATATARVGAVTDALARALVWTCTWDMTLDACLAARDYVTMALRGLESETDITTVQATQRRISEALDRYVHPAWAGSGRTALAELAHQRLWAADPGSDVQVTWARTLAAAARSADQLAGLRDLLDGVQVVPGLALDADLRWALLLPLVALGAASGADIEAELVREPTQFGRRRAATARALLPIPEAKADAWRLATEDRQLSNALSEAVVDGFHHPAQTALTAAYIAPYFEVALAVWERAAGEVGQTLVRGLFPAAVSEDVVAAAEVFLRDPALPPALRRIVAEERAATVRALRARARDTGKVTELVGGARRR